MPEAPAHRTESNISVSVTSLKQRGTVFRGSGSACESDGDDSDGQGAPQGGGGGAKHPRLGPRSGNFAGLRSLEAIFMRENRRVILQPQPPESSCFLSDVFSRLCVWREGETSHSTNGVLDNGQC